MNKQEFYLYVQRYLLNFVVDLNVCNPLNIVLTELSTYFPKNQYNTSLNSFKLKILECKYSTKGIETLNFKKTFFIQEQYKFSKHLVCAPYFKTLEIIVCCNYFFLHELSRIPLVDKSPKQLGGISGIKKGHQHLTLLKINVPLSKFFYVNSRILYASRKINNTIYFKRLCLSQKDGKVLTFFYLTHVKKVMTNNLLLSKPFFSRKKSLKGLWSRLVGRSPFGTKKDHCTGDLWPWCRICRYQDKVDKWKALVWLGEGPKWNKARGAFSTKKGLSAVLRKLDCCACWACCAEQAQQAKSANQHSTGYNYQDHGGIKDSKTLTRIKLENFHYFQLFRPLITLTRVDSFYICESLKLPVYPDKSNNQVQFLRNRVRKQILPAIRILLNPQFDTLFCKFSESYTENQK